MCSLVKLELVPDKECQGLPIVLCFDELVRNRSEWAGSERLGAHIGLHLYVALLLIMMPLLKMPTLRQNIPQSNQVSLIEILQG